MAINKHGDLREPGMFLTTLKPGWYMELLWGDLHTVAGNGALTGPRVNGSSVAFKDKLASESP